MKKLSFLLAAALSVMVVSCEMPAPDTPGREDDPKENPEVPDGPGQDPGTDPVITISTEQLVDLGLSVKWAGWNVGASKPEEYGDYFAWGETSPKDSYWQDNYKYGTFNKYGTDDNILKYNVRSEYGNVDGRTRLIAADDAAHVNWGGEWRMPTDEEKTELLAGTTHTPYVYNEVPGWVFTSKKNNVSIFFPATGVKEQTVTKYVGEETMFWTCTVSSNDPRTAHVACNWIEDSQLLHEAGFEMDPTAESFHLCKWRYFGVPVRAVSGGTIPDDPYTLTTSEAEEITPYSARVKVTLIPSAATAEIGLVYTNLDGCALLPGQAFQAPADKDGYVMVTGLSPYIQYRACAYAIVDGKTYTGNTITFTTLEGIDLTILDATDITSGSATLNGRVGDLKSLADAGLEVECGIAYDKTAYGHSSITGESKHIVLTPDGQGNISGTALALNSNTQYYCRTYLKVGHTFYFSSLYKDFTTAYPPLDKWVDLGLSVMWANWDLGSESGADSAGSQYAWGETTARTDFSPSSYKWTDSKGDMTKYVSNPSAAHVDGKTTLEAADDAATAAWGLQNARIPTKAEWEELLEKCTVTDEYYMSSRKVKFTGPNGNSVYINYNTNYWTSTLDSSDNKEAHTVSVRQKGYIWQDTYPRYAGRAVRAVKPVEEVIN